MEQVWSGGGTECLDAGWEVHVRLQVVVKFLLSDVQGLHGMAYIIIRFYL